MIDREGTIAAPLLDVALVNPQARTAEEEWELAYAPEPMVQSLVRNGKAGERRLRRFAVACCQPIRSLIPEGIWAQAIELAERLADGKASADDLVALRTNDYSNAPAGVSQQTRCAVWAVAWATVRPLDANAATSCCRIAAEAYSLLPDAPIYDTVQPLHTDYDRSFWITSHQIALVRDIFGNPFRPVTFSPEWRTDTAVSLAHTMYESREFSAMPILADALQDAGCDKDDVLNHCRGPGPHVRGCWVVDLVLGKE
jgi:hypothetical protein